MQRRRLKTRAIKLFFSPSLSPNGIDTTGVRMGRTHPRRTNQPHTWTHRSRSLSSQPPSPESYNVRVTLSVLLQHGVLAGKHRAPPSRICTLALPPFLPPSPCASSIGLRASASTPTPVPPLEREGDGSEFQRGSLFGSEFSSSSSSESELSSCFLLLL